MIVRYQELSMGGVSVSSHVELKGIYRLKMSKTANFDTLFY